MLLTYNNSDSLSRDDKGESRRLHFYDRGEQIPLATEGVWQVYRGVAQLSQVSVGGEEILLGWVQADGFLGMWLTDLESYGAKALTEVYLRWFSLGEIEANPTLSQALLTQSLRRLKQSEALLAIGGLKRVEEKLQQLLKLLQQDLGQPIAGGNRLSVRLTHQNLANAIGTTRVTITRLLGDFQRQGLITLDQERHLIILD
ncbi:MAG: Crp/Fnr family transcriptional regulator [Chlorogloea purpurea SAG 13.99]|nr:Crp/Fnr family transcriptional regulator [Chlorogloea purpurea SAG 13.99]